MNNIANLPERTIKRLEALAQDLADLAAEEFAGRNIAIMLDYVNTGTARPNYGIAINDPNLNFETIFYDIHFMEEEK